jgi:uncharacterized protein (DUF952 family)
MRVFHIVDRATWAAAAAAGSYVPEDYATDGFVHCSFADQVAATANRFYRDAENLVVVELETDAVPAELRIEDTGGTGQRFPHLYGPVPVAAQAAQHELRRDPHGDWVL